MSKVILFFLLIASMLCNLYLYEYKPNLYSKQYKKLVKKYKKKRLKIKDLNSQIELININNDDADKIIMGLYSEITSLNVAIKKKPKFIKGKTIRIKGKTIRLKGKPYPVYVDRACPTVFVPKKPKVSVHSKMGLPLMTKQRPFRLTCKKDERLLGEVCFPMEMLQ